MRRDDLLELLEDVAAGKLSSTEAAKRLQTQPSAELGFARLDLQREQRTGVPEAVYAEGKSPDELVAIVARLVEEQGRALITRLHEHKAELLVSAHPDAKYHARGRILAIGRSRARSQGKIAVLSAGTSDRPTTEEARVTAQWHGFEVESYDDVGVAGLHRLVDQLDDIRQADVLIVVAGMEGALPAVVAGLTKAAVIAVPTSVGYGASFSGLAALLTMLNTCAPGVSVVNIDNGYGAAVVATRILRAKSPCM